MWEIRESGLAATVSVPGQPNTWEGWEDAGVPVETLGGYLRDLRALAGRYGYRCPLYGHFGDGCVHNRMTYDLRTPEGVAAYRAFVEEAADLVAGLRRLAVGRARRRAEPGRAAAEDVRPRAGRGVPRVQVHLGSRAGG